MKRGSDGDMESPNKRFRNLEYEIRALIPSRAAGSIIGKSGSNITRLRKENRATISVPDCSGPERILTISSDDSDTTFGVLREVVSLIVDDDRNRGPEEEVAGGGGGEVELRLLYHQSQAGGIIGKGGSNIKELRKNTNTQIKVYGECCPRSTDRVVSVFGPIESVLAAVKEISLFVLDNPIRGPTEFYEPHNFDDMAAAGYGGYGGGGFGGRGGGGFERGGGAGGGYGGGGGRMASGPPAADRYYRGGGEEARGGGYRGGGDDGGRRGGFRGGSDGGRSGSYRGGGDRGRGGGGGGRNGREAFGGGGDEETTQVTIPKEYAGAIIGKGGSRIRQIRFDSGAKINIDEALPGAEDRVITIGGSSEQIKMAQYLLQQSVKDYGDPANKL